MSRAFVMYVLAERGATVAQRSLLTAYEPSNRRLTPQRLEWFLRRFPHHVALAIHRLNRFEPAAIRRALDLLTA